MKYSVHKLLRLSWKIVMTGLVLPFSALTKAEVTLDGTLSPAGSLAGPNFVIPDTVGQTVGTNLFHSFGLFNINTGESATFTGPSSIENVLGRVTGGSSSFIDGLLRTQFENASPNLFLLNPAGVLFGPNASLDVQGSFHVSTADYLKLGDGGRFEATNPENSVLTVAPPEAFGFLGERQPAGIAVQGSRLQVPAGETLSVVGGDIRIADGSLYAPGGRIDMVSVASPGEVLPHAPDLGVASFERLGRIKVSHASSERPVIDGNEIGNVDASGEGGGRIFIRGGEFVADNAGIFADTRGSGEGQGIDIGVTGQVTMRNGAGITANTFGSGSGGDLTVKADKMFLSGDFTGIRALYSGAGSRDLGDIAVTAGSLEVRNGAGIHTSPFVQGEGGDVTVTADRVLLSGDGGFLTGISSGGNIFNVGIFPGGGGAGNVTVTAGSLEVRNGAGISTEGQSVAVDNTPVAPGITRRSGDVTVTADRVLLSGDGATPTGITTTGFGITAAEFGPAEFGPLRIDAGNVTIQAGSLEVLNGAQISASFSGNEGQGGNVTVEADRVFLSGDGANFEEVLLPTGIFAQAFGGSAGDVAVTAGNLEVRNGAVISTSTLGGGPGGNVTVEADRVFLSGDGATDFAGFPIPTGIFANTFGDGHAGSISIEAGDLELTNDAAAIPGLR